MNTQNLQQKNGVYSHENPIKFLTSSLESSPYVLMHMF